MALYDAREEKKEGNQRDESPPADESVKNNDTQSLHQEQEGLWVALARAVSVEGRE